MQAHLCGKLWTPDLQEHLFWLDLERVPGDAMHLRWSLRHDLETRRRRPSLSFGEITRPAHVALEVRLKGRARAIDGALDDEPVTSIELELGTPSKGWIEVELAGAEGCSRIVASSVLGDPLEELAGALCGLLDGRDECEVGWFLEPELVTWTFRRDGESVAIFTDTVFTGVDERRLFPIGTTRVRDVARVGWEALRTLQASPVWTRGDGRRG